MENEFDEEELTLDLIAPLGGTEVMFIHFLFLINTLRTVLLLRVI